MLTFIVLYQITLQTVYCLAGFEAKYTQHSQKDNALQRFVINEAFQQDLRIENIFILFFSLLLVMMTSQFKTKI